MQTICIYYLILVIMSSHISTYQHQAFMRKQQKEIKISHNIQHEILNETVFTSREYEAEDLWAMELVKEERMPEVGEKIVNRSKREQEETVVKQVENENRDKQVQQNRNENRESLKQEEKESQSIQQEEKHKNESSGEGKESRQENRNKEETLKDNLKEDYQDNHKEDYQENDKESHEGNIKDNKEIPAQNKSENSEGEKGESPQKPNTKEVIITQHNNEQTTASSYNFETTEPKIENSVGEKAQSEKEFNESIQGKLQQNQVIKGDVHIEENGLDLNGQTLEIWGNLYQNQGTLSIHNGKLVIHGSYFINQEIKKSGNNSVLVLDHEDDIIMVGGDIISYGTGWLKKCIKGKIVLEGDFMGTPKASQMYYHTPLRSEWELVLAGENNQKVDISSMWVKLPTIKIIGKNNREIKLIMLKDDTIQKRKHHLNNLEIEVACQIELPESLIIENINAKASLIINGNCEAKQLNIFGHKVTINGNLKIQDGISFMKGQVVVNGSLSLVTARCIDMKYGEDRLKIKDDFIMLNCKEITLNEGKLHIGGNMIQHSALGKFMTRDKVSVVFLNDQNGQQRVQGNLITLNGVEYSPLTWKEEI